MPLPRSDDAVRSLGGAAGVVGPVAYVATWALLGATRPGFDPVRQAISELGEQGAATAPAMSAAFAAFGVLALPFAASLVRGLSPEAAERTPRLAIAAGAAAAVCGIATAGAALFPCSPGCPGPGTTATDTGHAVVAVVGYLALMATPLLAGLHLRRSPSPVRRRAGTWSIAAGAVGSVLMLLWALGLFGEAGGAAQRTFNTVADVWWLFAGAAILRVPTAPHA